jgi:hypothetical protein
VLCRGGQENPEAVEFQTKADQRGIPKSSKEGIMSLETPWNRARKTKSQKQEERLGKNEHGSKQNNSGRFWRWKRDGKLHGFLIEARTTEKGSYSIDYVDFKTLEKQAHQEPPGCLPGMQVDIRDLSLMVMKLQDFEDREVKILDLEAKLENATQ